MTSEYGTKNERLEVAGRLYIALCAQYPGRFITLLAAATWRPKLEGNGRSAAAHARYFLARLSCPQLLGGPSGIGFKQLNKFRVEQ
jgi:hypothetical protein